jgi:flagellar biosynthesis protein FlhB
LFIETCFYFLNPYRENHALWLAMVLFVFARGAIETFLFQAVCLFPDSIKPGISKQKSSKKYFDVDGLVFWPSAFIIVAFISITLIVGEPMDQVFSAIQSSISSYGGWFFVLSVNIFLFFVLECG